MHDNLESLYLPEGNGFVGTLLTQGPWHPKHQHGGPVAALIARCVQAVHSLTNMEITRLTFDLVRPVPIGQRLDIATHVLRQGKKVQLIEAILRVGDVEHVRCTALRLRAEDLGEARQAPVSNIVDSLVPDIGSFKPVHLEFPYTPFLRAVKILRFPVAGSNNMVVGYWIHLAVPLVAGEVTTPLSRLCLAADLTNCIGVPVDEVKLAAINADITVQILRPLTGAFVALVGDTRFAMNSGIATSAATLHDVEGVCATASTSQLVQLR